MPKYHPYSGVFNLVHDWITRSLQLALTEMALSGAHTLVVIGWSNHLYNPILVFVARDSSSFIYVHWFLHDWLCSSVVVFVIFILFSLVPYVIFPGVRWKGWKSLPLKSGWHAFCISDYALAHGMSSSYCLISCCQHYVHCVLQLSSLWGLTFVQLLHWMSYMSTISVLRWLIRCSSVFEPAVVSLLYT